MNQRMQSPITHCDVCTHCLQDIPQHFCCGSHSTHVHTVDDGRDYPQGDLTGEGYAIAFKPLRILRVRTLAPCAAGRRGT